MKYLEESQLIQNQSYDCETYSGEKVRLTWLGGGNFTNGLSLYGDVRYVFESEKCYRVYGSRGHYEDITEWTLKVFRKKKSADDFCELLNNWLSETQAKKLSCEEKQKVICPYDSQFDNNYLEDKRYPSENTQYFVEECDFIE